MWRFVTAALENKDIQETPVSKTPLKRKQGWNAVGIHLESRAVGSCVSVDPFCSTVTFTNLGLVATEMETVPLSQGVV